MTHDYSGMTPGAWKKEMTDTTSTTDTVPDQPPSPWLTVGEAADRARCGVNLIYRATKAKTHRLQSVPLGGRREVRTTAEWVDAWLMGQATIQ